MTRPKMKIRKGDRVIVISGRDKGKIGEVIGVFARENRALVQGVHIVKRHQRPSQTGPGGIQERESRIHISNIALMDPSTKKATKVGFKIMEDGAKARIARKSGEAIPNG